MPSLVVGAIFFIYLLIIAVLSGPILKKIYTIFDGLEVYHKLPKHYPPGSNRGEAFPVKCYYVIKFLLILQAIGTAFGLTYLTYITGVELVTIESSVALGFFTTVLVLTVRQASFSSVGEPRDPEVMKQLKASAHTFAFGFFLTIYFLSLFGFGVGLINNEIPLAFELTESIDLVNGFMYSALFIAFPIGLGVLNEASLYLLEVPEELMEEAPEKGMERLE